MVPSEGIAILLGFGLPIAFFLFAISRGVWSYRLPFLRALAGFSLVPIEVALSPGGP